MTFIQFSSCIVLSSLVISLLAPTAVCAQDGETSSRAADYIIAVVNQELVTAGELQLSLNRVREDAKRTGSRLPPDDELRRQLIEALIDERIQVTNARESGQRIDDAEVERAVANIAAQSQSTVTQLRERLRSEGIEYTRFRNNLRDQMMVERQREREVQARINISDSEIDEFLEKQRRQAGAVTEFNIAQILVTVPEGAGENVVAERRARAEAALARVKKGGEAFEVVAKQVSEDASKVKGGEMGLRAVDRLPDVFVQVISTLRVGGVAPTVLRTGAGFHVLKLIERRETDAVQIAQTRARHILLRTSAQLSQVAAVRRLQEVKRQLTSGARNFEQLARDISEDSSASQGGDLGWVSPGNFVPEFEDAMNKLAVDGISEPVVSRFGVHLIQVVARRKVALDIKQQRELARRALREQKFEVAYAEWLRELRSRAYVEMREPTR